MKITKGHLRKIIKEETAQILDECPSADSEMPCPIKTAAALRSAGASGDDVLRWIDLLISEFNQGSEIVSMEDEGPIEIDYTGDLMDLTPEEAFGLGRVTGEEGL
tara:strand:- start:1156 stop:1470 length:315 start_codon:yes stop_codon:yes gene_type:complete